jgi:branched-chain amino acid transport system ATP-binding protein
LSQALASDLPPALELRHVSHQFGSLKVLQDISLVVPRGQRRAIIGPNGAGKTTLFNIMAGEMRPTGGQVLLNGRDVTNLPAFRHAALGVSRTFQTTALFPKLTLLENVGLAIQAYQRGSMNMLRPRSWFSDWEEQARRLVAAAGLEARAYAPISGLSYGEQRQLEILLALAQQPRFLLLDEPTAGLSRGDVPAVLQPLKELSQDVTVVLIEHDMDVVFGLVDQISVMHNGEKVAEGTVAEVRANEVVQEIYLGGVR